MATSLPWRSERALDAEGVRRLVDSQFPALAPCRAAYLDEGFDSEVFDVTSSRGEAWVFRFPKRAEVQAGQEKEVRLLPRIAPVLDLPVPGLECVGTPDATFPFRFVGYRKLAGVPGVRLDEVDAHAIARQLGGFLTRLHAFPAEEARALGATGGIRTDVPAWFERMRARVEQVADALEPGLHARLRAFFGDPRNAPAPHEGPACLVHDDLHGEHVLVDPAGRRAVGVIDWGDATLGDPALDFAGIRQWLGEPAVETALDAYGLPVAPGIRERARAGAVSHALGCLVYGLLGGRPLYREIGRRSLEREFPG